jgi:EmrB/QacA subfamily drug resistance transporter
MAPVATEPHGTEPAAGAGALTSRDPAWNPNRWRALPVILVATFMSLFDVFVVNVAAPSVASDLSASNGSIELIIAGYSLTYAAFLITGGRLGDRFGRRRMFLWGLTTFSVASLLCGLAPNEASLIIGRLLQGAAAASMIPQVLALINVSFPPQERARAFAYFGVTIGVGSFSGQALGGLLLHLDIFGLGWRPIFLVNVPIGLVAAVAATRLVTESRSHAPERLDPVGLLGLIASIGLALVPLTMGRDEGWPAWTWISLAAGIATFTGFVAWEASLARRGGHPIVPPAVLRDRQVTAGLVTNLGFFIFFGSFLLSLTIFLQEGQFRSPLDAGLVFSPLGVAFAISSMVGRRLVTSYGARVLTAGSAISFIAVAGFIVLLGARGADAPTYLMVPLLTGIGVGNGLAIPSLIAAVLSGVPADISGTVSGIMTTTQQFALALGIALIGIVFFSQTASHGPASGLRAALICDLVALGFTGLATLALPRGLNAPAAPAAAVVPEQSPEAPGPVAA